MGYTSVNLALFISELGVNFFIIGMSALSITSTSLYWEEVMGSDNLHILIDVADKGDVNYYYYRILRNGELFKWNVAKDIDNSPTMQFNVSLMNRKKAEEAKPEDYDSILFEGDEITVEVRAIDIKAYFSAYTVATAKFIFGYGLIRSNIFDINQSVEDSKDDETGGRVYA